VTGEVEGMLIQHIEDLERVVVPDDTLTTLMTTAGKFLEEMACYKVKIFSKSGLRP